MPTPLGHSLAGLAIQFASTGTRVRRTWPSTLLLIALANIPDIDFLPGYAIGRPAAYHWGPTHSFTAAVLVGGIAGLVLGAKNGRYLVSSILTTSAYASHIMLDLLFGQTRSPSLGLQVFWPFSTERFLLPWHVFRMAPISINASPITTLFSVEMLPVIARELIVMLPVVFLSWVLARTRNNNELTRA
jgi:membrane-bound metal-dependent hydrolase YbcI (DUF457 family)